MRRLVVYTVFFILALAIAAALWIGAKEYQRSRPRSLAAMQAQVIYPVTIWTYGDSTAGDTYYRTVSDLEKVMGRRLLLKVYSSREQLLGALKEAAPKSKLPDVFMAEVQDFAPFHAAGQLKPILLKETPAMEWIPDIFNAFVRNNTIVAYPSEYSLLVLYYNRRHFDRIGVGYPDTHWNWQTMEEVGRALYRPPEHPKGIVYGLEYTPSFEWWNALACQAGDGLYRGPSWLWFMPDSMPAIRDSLQYLIDLHKTFTFCAPIPRSPLPPTFMQGNCAMTIAGPGLRTPLQKDPNFQWGITIVPRKNSVATPLYARGWAVTADTRSAEAAVAVAQTMSHVVTDGWLSARPSRNTEEMSTDYTTVFQVALRYAKPAFWHPKNAIVKQIVEQSLARLGDNGPMDVDEVLAHIEGALAPLELTLAPTTDGREIFSEGTPR